MIRLILGNLLLLNSYEVWSPSMWPENLFFTIFLLQFYEWIWWNLKPETIPPCCQAVDAIFWMHLGSPPWINTLHVKTLHLVLHQSIILSIFSQSIDLASNLANTHIFYYYCERTISYFLIALPLFLNFVLSIKLQMISKNLWTVTLVLLLIISMK